MKKTLEYYMSLTSEIRTFKRPGGEIQRVQAVRAARWQDLCFVRPQMTPEAFAALVEVYRDQVVARVPWVFGELVLFHIPEDVALPEEMRREGITDRHLLARQYFRRHFGDAASARLVRTLRERGYLATVKGKRPFARSFLPFGEGIGFLSETAADWAAVSSKETAEGSSKGFSKEALSAETLAANASFFTFDLLDASSPYDTFGTPLGLLVKDGVVENPPLFGREALLVDRAGNICVRKVELSELQIEIAPSDEAGGLRSEQSCAPSDKSGVPLKGQLYERPARRVTPRGRDVMDVVIIGTQVAAVRPGGGTVIPCSGFVLQMNAADLSETVEISGGADTGQQWTPAPGDAVIYRGMEDIAFGIQVGNSLIVNGAKTTRFLSPFYNLFKLERVPYPPSLYPLDFEKARAPRMALGADAEGRPVFLWAEGAPKIGYQAGRDSCGATLAEMADIAEAFGLTNAINLDGGGSAQLLLNQKRDLQLSGRRPSDGCEVERPIPLGIAVCENGQL